MFLRKGRHMAFRSKVLVIAVLALATGGAVARASGVNVWIGTHGDDVINKSEEPGNFHLWGLAGADVLIGGKGENLIIGDGHCPYDNQVPTHGQDDSYCEISQVRDDPGDILIGGRGGANTIFGGGGPNVILAGPATHGTEPFGTGNLIYGGPIGDAIDATDGSSTVYAGRGFNVIDAVGPRIDHIICERGDEHTVVFANRSDIVENCAVTIRVRALGKGPAWRARAVLRVQEQCVRAAIHGSHGRIDRNHCGPGAL
jgi:hypothetical protein